MAVWQILLTAAAGVCVVAAWYFAVCRERHTEQELRRRLDSLLQPRERILRICPQKDGFCVLTNTRLLVEKNGVFSAYSRRELLRIQGHKPDGSRTTVLTQAATLTLKFQKTVVLDNSGSEFLQLAMYLQKDVRKNTGLKKAVSPKCSAASKKTSRAKPKKQPKGSKNSQRTS